MKRSYYILAALLALSVTMLKADDDCDYTKIDPQNFTCGKPVTKDKLLAEIADLQSRIDRNNAALDEFKKRITLENAGWQAQLDKRLAALNQLQ